MGLTFEPTKMVYDDDRDLVLFVGLDGALMIRCAVSREALMDKARSMHATPEDLVDICIAHLDEIRRIADGKYTAKQFEADGSVLVKTGDLNPR